MLKTVILERENQDVENLSNENNKDVKHLPVC